MSEHIETLVKDKVITSFAVGGVYQLAIHNKESAPNHFLFMGSDVEYSYEEYCDILKQMWVDYLQDNKRPGLLDLSLSDDGLVTETLHCIAPCSFTAPGGSPLPEYRERFASWIKSRQVEISLKIGEGPAQDLYGYLDSVLGMHYSRRARA